MILLPLIFNSPTTIQQPDDSNDPPSPINTSISNSFSDSPLSLDLPSLNSDPSLTISPSQNLPNPLLPPIPTKCYPTKIHNPNPRYFCNSYAFSLDNSPDFHLYEPRTFTPMKGGNKPSIKKLHLSLKTTPGN